MTRLVAKLFLLALPLWFLAGVDLVLPVDAFVFRAWEALVITNRPADSQLRAIFPCTALPGPFLPDTRLERIETGDLGHDTPSAEPHRVVWETDEYGYRARPSRITPELVIIGDSLVVGSGLSQEDTLAEVLRRGHGIQAYPYAPATPADFLQDPRFREQPPRFVVLACIERQILEPSGLVRSEEPMRHPARWVRSLGLRAAEFAWVRMMRLNLLGYLRAKVNGRLPRPTHGGTLFLQGIAANTPPNQADLEAASARLAQHATATRARGMEFAFLAVPNKETIYADLIPGSSAPSTLPRLQEALRHRGVVSLDVEGALRQAREDQVSPYLRDDTHWSPTGVKIAAAAIAGWVHQHSGTQGAPVPGSRTLNRLATSPSE